MSGYIVGMQKDDPWRRRLKDVGLTQIDVTRVLGCSRSTVARGLDQDPPSKPVRAVIVAAELMTGEMRARWLAALADDERKEDAA